MDILTTQMLRVFSLKREIVYVSLDRLNNHLSLLILRWGMDIIGNRDILQTRAIKPTKDAVAQPKFRQ
jgi:hypothetical protein